MSTFRLPVITATGFLAFVSVPHVFANDAVSKMETVVVTASSYEQSQADAPASISVISREELDSRYYRDVTDALKSVPGVVVTGGGDTTDISIRGMGSKYTLILVDGKRQSTRETRPNSDGPGIEQGWLPPLQSIERIEVIRGPMSTLYGSDAIGGVINVITRKDALEWTGNVQLGTVLQENSRSGGEQSANFFVNGPLAENLSLQVYGQYTTREEDDIEYGYEDKDIQSISSKLTYQINDRHSVQLEGGTSAQSRRGNVGLSVPTTGCRGGCEDSLNEYRRNYVTVSHNGDWDSIGISDTYLQREESENKSREMTITNTTFKSSLVTGIGNHTLTTGVDATHAELEDFTSNKASSKTETSNTQWAVFIEDEWRIADPFSVTLGGRLDHDENYGAHFSPRVYGVWRVDPSWTVKGGVATGFRSPQLREITPGWAQVSGGGNIYGNPDLDPETSLNKEISVLYQGDSGLDVSLTAFHNEFKDKITRVVCPDTICTDGPNQWGADPTYRINVDEAVTKGIEATLASPLTETIYLSSSYTFTDSEQKTGEYKGMPLQQLPKRLFNLDVTWQTTADLESWAKVTYRGKEMDPVTGPSRNSIVEPAYTFVDAGVTYQLTDNTRIKGAIYNLLDEKISYEEYGYIEDGRRYWLGLNVAF